MGLNGSRAACTLSNADMNAVKCVLIVRELAQTYTWFSTCVKDIRMLRIEEDNDLLPAVNAPIEGGDRVEQGLV